MKPLVWTIVAASTVAVTVPVVAQYPGMNQPQPRNRELQMPMMPNWVVGHSQRAGTQQIVELVPKGQSVQRYTKMITMSSFVPRPGITQNAVLTGFAQRYQATCPRSISSAMGLGGGNVGVRIDCPRHPKTGRPETVFARAVAAPPAMAIVQYMTTYKTPPGESALARDFLGRVGVR